jgi:hypothetical protein
LEPSLAIANSLLMDEDKVVSRRSSRKIGSSPNESKLRQAELIVSNSATIRTLAALRDTLLPRLISGKLRVPEADKMFEVVL